MIVGAVLAVASLIAFVVCLEVTVARAAQPLIRIVDVPVLQTPIDQTLDLRDTSYVVYERIGRERRTGTHDSPPTLDAASFTVTAPDGTAVDVKDAGFGTETVTRNGVVYTAVARFTTQTAGSYRIAAPAPAGRQVIVNRSLGSGLRGLRPWAFGAAGSAVVGLIGLVMVLIGWVIRFGGPPPR
jgi:hypothetical protein